MLDVKIRGIKSPRSGIVAYYPQISEIGSPINIEQICAQISTVCTASPADVKAVLNALQDAIITFISDGQSVRLGDLGSFRVTLISQPSDTKDEVTEANIENVHVVYYPSVNLKKSLRPENLSFRIVD